MKTVRLNESQFKNFITECTLRVLNEISGNKCGEPRIKPGSQEEQYILYNVNKNKDISHRMLYTISKQLGCSKEAVETVLRRHGILPKYNKRYSPDFFDGWIV